MINENQKKTTDDYRDNYDRIFKKKPEDDKDECPKCGKGPESCPPHTRISGDYVR